MTLTRLQVFPPCARRHDRSGDHALHRRRGARHGTGPLGASFGAGAPDVPSFAQAARTHRR